MPADSKLKEKAKKLREKLLDADYKYYVLARPDIDDYEYDKLMKDVYANLDQVPKTPFINFEKNTLVAVFIGARNSGGYMVNIDSINEGSKNLTVFVTETKPGKSCVVTDAITKPFVIVKIPKTDKKPVYKYNEIVNECQ